MKLRDLANKVQTAVTNAANQTESPKGWGGEGVTIGATLEHAAENAKAAFDATRPEREAAKDGFDQTRHAREFAYGVITSDAAWGKSVPVDTGTETPMRVGYGDSLRTLGEVATPKPARPPDGVELAGARARLYGDASSSTLSAALGLEAEAGFKLSGKGQGEWGSSFGEVFVGARNRETVEAGALGQSIGSETFIGAEAFGSEHVNMDGAGDDSNTLDVAAQVQAGFRAGARAGTTAIGLSGEERMEFGIRGRAEADRDIGLIGPVGERLGAQGDAFAGMTEGGHVKAGLTGLGAGGEWFAGVRAGGEIRWALSVAKTELVGIGIKGEAWAGLGAKANAGLGWDKEHKQVKGNVDAGLAIGVGAEVGTEVTMGGDGLVDIGDGGKADSTTGGRSSDHGGDLSDELE